jgi:nucleotide-binding universal stress UspA family protein
MSETMLILIGAFAVLLIALFLFVSVRGMRLAARPHEKSAEPGAGPVRRRPLRILVATDGSECSSRAVESVVARPWPAGSRVRVVTVVHTNLPLVPEPFLTGAAAHFQTLEEDRQRAPVRVQAARARLASAISAAVESAVLEGDPADVIVDDASRWHADLVVVGTHGRGGLKRLVLGSVAEGVVRRAPCSVEVVRCAEAA